MLTTWQQSLGKLVLFDVTKKEVCSLSTESRLEGGTSHAFSLHQVLNIRWQSHSGRIYDIAWTPDSLHAASAGLDTHVFVWNVNKSTSAVALRSAAPGGAFAVDWIGDNKLTVAGADGCVRVFNVTF